MFYKIYLQERQVCLLQMRAARKVN